MSAPLYAGFDDWTDVQSQFEMTDAEPEQVILAVYEQEGYEGDATVIYRNGDRYFHASGSHCSCYGLEGQWSPDEMSRESLLGHVARANYGVFMDYAEAIRKAVAA